MSDLRIYPARLQGEINAPPSKSAAHRALICASLADGTSRVTPLSNSQDMAATGQVLSALGARIQRMGDTAVITGIGGGGLAEGKLALNCKESGSTLRFLLPIASALGVNAIFTGEGRLPERPVGVLAEQMRKHGAVFSSEKMPFEISGRLTGGRYFLPGDVSSQFVSGLLFALPLAEEDSEIILTSPLESAGYVEMTLAALAESGIEVTVSGEGIRIRGGQQYRAGDKTVEGDYSNAAFWFCAGAAGGDVSVRGLETRSVQGDRAIVEIIRRFGGNLSAECGRIRCRELPLTGCRIDAAPIPDLVPILAVMAAFARGDTEIYNAARLRIKESDRLATVTALLRALGGTAEEFPDRLVIHGGGLRGGTVNGANDHRIVMSAAIAAQLCKEPVCIIGAQAIEKSYPNFFEDMKKLGGRYDVI